MAGLPSIDWSRLGVEAIVIIFSVLAALALDDWRDARADRELERYLLVSLQGDLAADLEELKSVLESDEAAEQASNFLLGRSDVYSIDEFGSIVPGLSRLIEQSPDAAQAAPRQAAIGALASGTGDFDLSDITFQEMMSTGSLRVIRNTELRREISRYYWFIRSFNIANTTAEAYRSQFLRALLRIGVAPGAVGTEQVMLVTDDKEVRALVDQLGATARTQHNVHSTFIEQAEQLLAAVSAELGK